MILPASRPPPSNGSRVEHGLLCASGAAQNRSRFWKPRKQHRKGVRMNFNFGEVLTRAWQITWKHKNLWLAGIVVTLISFLSVPISLLFNPSFSSLSDPSEVNK